MFKSIREEIQSIKNRDPAARSTLEVILSPDCPFSLAAQAKIWGQVLIHYQPFSDQYRNSSGSKNRQALFYRSRGGCGYRRNGGDWR